MSKKMKKKKNFSSKSVQQPANSADFFKDRYRWLKRLMALLICILLILGVILIPVMGIM